MQHLAASPHYPCLAPAWRGVFTNESRFSSTVQPNLSRVSGRLGNWLRRGRPSGGIWSSPRSIPTTWARRAEDAIVYEIDAGEGGISNLTGHFGVDNGIWVWVNGVFKFGAIKPGDAVKFEYANIPLGNLPPGRNYIQILRLDSYKGSGYHVRITGNTNGGRPGVDTPGSFFRGNNYFFGGTNSTFGIASQTIDVSAGADLIDDGEVVFELIGYLGGHSTSEDSAKVTAVLKDENGAVLASGAIGPLSSSSRGKVPRLKRLTKMGDVPPGTRSVTVIAQVVRRSGNDADGYVDDLTLRLLTASGAVIRDMGLKDTHSGTVNWGDGTGTQTAQVEQEPGFALMLLSHTYKDNGQYTVDVVAQDDDGGRATGSFVNKVDNVAPLVTGVQNFFIVNRPTNNVLVATFDDPGVLDAPWRAKINWGDGTSSTGTVVNGQVRGSHTYRRVGSGTASEINASVTVTDKDGGSATGYMTNIVIPAAKELFGVHASPNWTILQGTPLTELSGGFRAVNKSGVTYEYSWDFGDTTGFGPVQVGASPGRQREGLTAPAHRYGRLGQFVVTFKVLAFFQGLLLGAGSDSFTVTVLNVAPTVNAGGPATVGEGVKLTRVAKFTDPGFDDIHTASIDWGDGTGARRGIVNEAARTITGSHVYDDNGTYTVKITVADDNGGVASGSFVVTVNNLAPVVEAGANQTPTEGDTVTLDPATFTDSGSADTHAATVDWGDTTPVEDRDVDQALDRVAGSHIYTDNGRYTVTVCVTDDDKAATCDSLIVDVGNANPVVFSGSNKSVQEGETSTISQTAFFDAGAADTHSATIDWGDNSSSGGTVDQKLDSVTANHEYANDGTHTVTIKVCDDNNGCGTGKLIVTVSNVPTEIVALQLQSASPVHIEGLPVTLTAPINDKGTLDSHTATIDWGDGTAIDAGSVAENPFGPPGDDAGADGTVTGSHEYADNGRYNVTLCVSDDDSTTCRTEGIDVTNAVPVVETGNNIVVNEGTFTSLDPASFTDSGFDSSTIPSEENFTATIDWGDGTTEPAADISLAETPGSVGVLTTGTIQASHAKGTTASTP